MPAASFAWDMAWGECGDSGAEVLPDYADGDADGDADGISGKACGGGEEAIEVEEVVCGLLFAEFCAEFGAGGMDI
jgi:hypothetical protein